MFKSRLKWVNKYVYMKRFMKNSVCGGLGSVIELEARRNIGNKVASYKVRTQHSLTSGSSLEWMGDTYMKINFTLPHGTKIIFDSEQMPSKIFVPLITGVVTGSAAGMLSDYSPFWSVGGVGFGAVSGELGRLGWLYFRHRKDRNSLFMDESHEPHVEDENDESYREASDVVEVGLDWAYAVRLGLLDILGDRRYDWFFDPNAIGDDIALEIHITSTLLDPFRVTNGEKNGRKLSTYLIKDRSQENFVEICRDAVSSVLPFKPDITRDRIESGEAGQALYLDLTRALLRTTSVRRQFSKKELRNIRSILRDCYTRRAKDQATQLAKNIRTGVDLKGHATKAAFQLALRSWLLGESTEILWRPELG